jgi:molybdopterin synthase sulfur carrier subunit
MRITVRYFALLRERVGLDCEVVSWQEAGLTVGRLRGHLAEREPALSAILLGSPLLVAVNREYAAADTPLKDGDEVALFPPVTGG